MIYDQAASLRNQVKKQPSKTKPTKVIAITSGKGGVGKSNFTVNFALAMMDKGFHTAVLDADIGLANVDVLLGLAPKYSLPDMVHHHLKIWDIMETGPLGLKLIAGGSALESMFELAEDQVHYLFEQILLLNGHFNMLLIDTGAGIHEDSLKFILSADEVFLVTTPEPTSITDAYAMIKILQAKKKDLKVFLIVNRVSSEQEAMHTAERIKMVTERFLDFKIQLLGYIYDDDSVRKAVKKQEPFYLSYPHSRAAQNIKSLVDTYHRDKHHVENTFGIRSFLSKFSNWLRG